ncbi:hypothetical protein [Aliiglaciecola lipolytica]|uniref:Lipoprotein n=1 Tax=Aliiglaciecola lipolytica E3 TaxID=1127673 RepID=K6Y6J8_9ALTE|nr:hypothetical protein [Aliiglaciecola lipolytica]GAC13827.1 hypothetical protein GLIP_1186 [Aliiglaciecola lipolytica E3]
MDSVKQLPLISIFVASTLAAGCASVTKTQPGILSNLLDEANNSAGKQVSNSPQTHPVYLQPYIAQNKKTGLRDQVLVNMRAGVTALEHGDHHITRRLMEDAYTRIETIYADNKAAKAARSNYVEEANKDFKGEPYERAMVGYYLGIADMLNDNLQSAKTAFSWGEYQDTMSAGEEYQADMTSLMFLRGWAKHCAGETSAAKDDFAAANLTPQQNANLLVLIESGQGPVKYASGKHSEKLKFKAAPQTDNGFIKIKFNEQNFYPDKIEDLVHQATTRNGRSIDAILQGKAEFKDSTKNVADVAAATATASLTYANVSSMYGDHNSAQNASAIGALFALGSLVAGAMSENTIPEADTRQWNNLPRFIHAQTMFADDDYALSDIVVSGEFGEVKIKPQQTGQCYFAWHKVSG